MPELFTHTFQAHDPNHSAAVRTTAYAPRWRLPYALAGHLTEVTPEARWLRLQPEPFAAAYLGQLDGHGIDAVLAAAERIADSAGTARLSLLCFCKPADLPLCHRTLLRAWLTSHDVPVLELALEG